MDTVRLIHFADLHLGVEAGGRPNRATGLNQRVHDVCDRLDELCSVAEDEGVHVVLFCGDTFKHQHPTPTLQRLFAQRMRRLARAGIRVFLLIGNHDLPKMAALAHPLEIYEALEVEGVVIGDRARLYAIALADGVELQVGALPHFSRSQVLSKMDDTDDRDATIEHAISQAVRRLADEVDPAQPAVFCGHCHVNQAVVSTSQAMFGLSDIEVPLSTLASTGAFAYYALGHIHHRQVLSTEPFVAYSGSLERIDFSEGEVAVVGANAAVERRQREAKGFYRFDLVQRGDRWTLDGAPAFREVSARPFITLRIEMDATGDPTAEVIGRIEAARSAGCTFESAFVKVAVTLDASDRGRLRHRDIRDAVAEAYDCRVAVTAADDAVAVRDPRFAERMGEEEALERYLETRQDWAPDREELSRLGRALIREVLA